MKTSSVIACLSAVLGIAVAFVGLIYMEGAPGVVIVTSGFLILLIGASQIYLNATNEKTIERLKIEIEHANRRAAEALPQKSEFSGHQIVWSTAKDANGRAAMVRQQSHGVEPPLAVTQSMVQAGPGKPWHPVETFAMDNGDLVMCDIPPAAESSSNMKASFIIAGQPK